jgi:hypothetical protein
MRKQERKSIVVRVGIYLSNKKQTIQTVNQIVPKLEHCKSPLLTDDPGMAWKSKISSNNAMFTGSNRYARAASPSSSKALLTGANTVNVASLSLNAASRPAALIAAHNVEVSSVLQATSAIVQPGTPVGERIVGDVVSVPTVGDAVTGAPVSTPVGAVVGASVPLTGGSGRSTAGGAEIGGDIDGTTVGDEVGAEVVGAKLVGADVTTTGVVGASVVTAVIFSILKVQTESNTRQNIMRDNRTIYPPPSSADLVLTAILPKLHGSFRYMLQYQS